MSSEDDSEFYQYVNLEEEYKNLPMEYRSDPEAQAAAEVAFNATLHDLYADLPPLTPLPDDEKAICTASCIYEYSNTPI